MARKKMKWYDKLALALIVVGAVVHGAQAFGAYPVDALGVAGKIVKGVVGVSGVYGAVMFFKLQ